MLLNTDTFKTKAGFIIGIIKSGDESMGSLAQEYADAVVAQKEGTGSIDDTEKVLNKFPDTKKLHPHMITLIADLFHLAVSYMSEQ